MGTDNIVFLENLEWFDETGKELTRHIPQFVEARLQDLVLPFGVVTRSMLLPIADLANVMPLKQRMPGDFFNLRSIDDDFGFRDADGKRQADISPGDRITILAIRDHSLGRHATINDLRGIVGVSG